MNSAFWYRFYLPFRLRFQLRPNKSGKPMVPHLLRCRGFAVDDYSFTLGRLGSGASSTFAQLGFYIQRVFDGVKPWSVSKITEKWFQNLQSGSRSRRAETTNRRNIGNISRIGRLGPTQRLGPRGGFETTSTHWDYLTRIGLVKTFDRLLKSRDISLPKNLGYFWVCHQHTLNIKKGNSDSTDVPM